MDEIGGDRTVFVLLAPDALARHLGGTIVDRLERLGYRPVAWRVLWHRPAELDAFHEKNIAQAWQAYLYRLVDQLFAFGPTVALLVHDDRPAGTDTSHLRLRRAKGASEPAGTGPGTIRGDLKSINAMLALVHSADSPADSRRESSVFAGPNGFDRGDPAELRTVLGLLDLARPVERRDYAEVLAGVRGRALAAAWEDLGSSGRRDAAAVSAGGAYELARPGAGDRIADLLPASHPLSPVLRGDFTPGCRGPDLDRVRVLLRLYGTDLDPWEELVLATSRRFSPRLRDPHINGLRDDTASQVTAPAAVQ